MNRLQAMWIGLRSSLWFLPSLIVLFSLLGAAVLVQAEGAVTDELIRSWPRLFGASAEGSRAMLGAIATSMITVAGVVFSITVVALSLASSQYSPRILRNFMSDRVTQWVLGVFVGVFAYCLVVLRTIRGGDELVFVPSLAVIAAMAYVLVAIGFLIYFIHHVADSIQASAIVANIRRETSAAIDRLYPQDVGRPASGEGRRQDPEQLSGWSPVLSRHTGYVVGIDGEEFLEFAAARDIVVRLPANGDFVIEGAPLLQVLCRTTDLAPEDRRRLSSWVVVGRQRTVEQDAAFGFQQLVDMAVRALSPGINDPTTACMCVDSLSALLARLAARGVPDPQRSSQGSLRVIAPAPGFGDILSLALLPVVRHSRGDLQVLTRLLDSVEVIKGQTADRSRHRHLADVARSVLTELNKLARTAEVADVRRRARQVGQAL